MSGRDIGMCVPVFARFSKLNREPCSACPFARTDVCKKRDGVVLGLSFASYVEFSCLERTATHISQTFEIWSQTESLGKILKQVMGINGNKFHSRRNSASGKESRNSREHCPLVAPNQLQGKEALGAAELERKRSPQIFGRQTLPS